MARPEVIILVGLQGSGKSSFYRARFAATHLHISKDNWPNATRREERQQRALRAALQNGQSVVVDNTNVAREQRTTIISITHEYEARVIGYIFELDVDACQTRNATRMGRARVPDVGLFATVARWESPTLDEGFAELYFVHLRDGGFKVSNNE